MAYSIPFALLRAREETRMAGLRATIVAAAQAEVAKQSNPPGPNGPVGQLPGQQFKDTNGKLVRGGYARLQQIYTDAIANFDRQNDASFKATDNTKPLGKDWCGIFAVSVLHRSGVDINWNLNTGGPSGNGFRPLYFWVRKDISAIPTSQRSAENVYLEAGDLVAIPENNHHFLVVGIDADRKTLRTVEGNTSYQQISANTRKLSTLTSIYKLTRRHQVPCRRVRRGARFARGCRGGWELGGHRFRFDLLLQVRQEPHRHLGLVSRWQ